MVIFMLDWRDTNVSSFENCSPEEIAVFAKIADGEPVEKQDPEIVQRLLERNLLTHITSTDLTVPAMVWNQWNHFKG
jgi:hypothetical protein